MDWEPEQLNLGALGFAGICRETYRVLTRAIHPANRGRGAAILSALFLARIAPDRLGTVAYILSKLLSTVFIFLLSVACTADYVLCVATLYCTDGDSGASDRAVRELLGFLHRGELPGAPLERLVGVFATVMPLFNLSITLSAFAWLELPQLDPSDKAVVLALQLLGGAAFLAGAVYVLVLSHLVSVVAMLEDLELDDICFATLCKSRTLLDGKFWAAAAVFVPLDVCCVALQMYFPVLVFDDALGLGGWFQVAAGAVMAVVLWAVLVVMLVAQPVLYLVCKNHHNEVVDKVHLNHIGEYQRLDVDSGMELQQVETTPQPTATTSARASPPPEGLPTPPAAPPALLQATSAQE